MNSAIGSRRARGRLPRSGWPRGPGAGLRALRSRMSASVSMRSFPAGVAEAASAAAGGRQRRPLEHLGALDARDHELRDPVAALDRHRALTEVGEDHGQLAAVIAVDGGGAVPAADPFTQREAGARPRVAISPI